MNFAMTFSAFQGFPSIEEDLLGTGALLVMPPFKKNQPGFQFSRKECNDAYKIASVREVLFNLVFTLPWLPC